VNTIGPFLDGIWGSLRPAFSDPILLACYLSVFFLLVDSFFKFLLLNVSLLDSLCDLTICGIGIFSQALSAAIYHARLEKNDMLIAAFVLLVYIIFWIGILIFKNKVNNSGFDERIKACLNGAPALCSALICLTAIYYSVTKLYV
jgi:hypothetical protein